MKHFFSLLAGLAAVCSVTGCQTGSPKPFTAARLEIGAPFESVTYEVQGGVMSLQEVGHNGRILAESQRTLTKAEEASLWTELDHLQVREWKKDYGVAVDEKGLPVTSWRLTTKRGRALATSQGTGAFPGDDRPTTVVKPDTSARFQSVYALFQKTMEPGAGVIGSEGGLVGR